MDNSILALGGLVEWKRQVGMMTYISYFTLRLCFRGVATIVVLISHCIQTEELAFRVVDSVGEQRQVTLVPLAPYASGHLLEQCEPIARKKRCWITGKTCEDA